MFGPADLALRRLAVCLPPFAGYALTRAATRRIDPAREQAAREIVTRNAARVLADHAAAARAGAGFVAALACDDLDALTAARWPRRLRLATTRSEGIEALPPGPLVVASFHFSGGFRIFDVLAAAGRRPTFLWAEDHDPQPSAYGDALRAARRHHLGRVLAGGSWIVPGPGARDALAAHLDAGGAVVALLDVAPEKIGLRDTAPVPLFGRAVALAVGLMRLAAARALPVVPYDGRIEGGRRVLRFHPAERAADPLELLAAVVRRLERIVLERPFDWQGWLDLDALIGPDPLAQAARDSDGS